jgi:hypothetical protein
MHAYIHTYIHTYMHTYIHTIQVCPHSLTHAILLVQLPHGQCNSNFKVICFVCHIRFKDDTLDKTHNYKHNSVNSDEFDAHKFENHRKRNAGSRSGPTSLTNLTLAMFRGLLTLFIYPSDNGH